MAETTRERVVCIGCGHDAALHWQSAFADVEHCMADGCFCTALHETTITERVIAPEGDQ